VCAFVRVCVCARFVLAVAVAVSPSLSWSLSVYPSFSASLPLCQSICRRNNFIAPLLQRVRCAWLPSAHSTRPDLQAIAAGWNLPISCPGSHVCCHSFLFVLIRLLHHPDSTNHIRRVDVRGVRLAALHAHIICSCSPRRFHLPSHSSLLCFPVRRRKERRGGSRADCARREARAPGNMPSRVVFDDIHALLLRRSRPSTLICAAVGTSMFAHGSRVLHRPLAACASAQRKFAGGLGVGAGHLGIYKPGSARHYQPFSRGR